MTASIGITYSATALLCAGAGAVCDVRTRKIPNALTGPTLLFGLLLHLGLGGWRSLCAAALAALIGGGVFLVFYLAGGMGAGDVKLMAAVCSVAGIGNVAGILIATALMGGILALIVALYRRRLIATLANIGALFGHHWMSGLSPHQDLNVSNP